MRSPALITILLCAHLVIVHLAAPVPLRAGDLVTDWNATLRTVIQLDGASTSSMANPGWSTRSMAMTNGAIYDIHQARNRTHQPLRVSGTITSDDVRDAAVNQAAYTLLTTLYNGSASNAAALAAYNTRMATISDTAAKNAGISLGNDVAATYLADRAGDGSAVSGSYAVNPAAGHWSSDPFHPGQSPWGPGWGTVTPFAIASQTAIRTTTPHLEVPALTAPTGDLSGILGSATYATYYNEVKDLGAVNSTSRTADQTEIGLFWGYDRPTLGPPPVLFNKALGEIVEQIGTNTADQNARLFAMASAAMADASITAWDAKFAYDFWRPVTAIQRGGEDGNAATVADAGWQPLGAPGAPDGTGASDFTPPFPAWPSGHATMGAAMFRTVENFYGTNSYAAITGSATYALTSDELLPGIWDTGTTPADVVRTFSSFTTHLDGGSPDLMSPEWENAISRVYLGIHWRFDATDGIRMGTAIADEIAVSTFQAVPEPGVILPAVGGLAMLGWLRRRRRGPSAGRALQRAGRGWPAARWRSR